jgi:hypothetical protein
VVERFEPDAVEVRNLLTGATSRIEDVDAVVMSIGSDVCASLFDALRGEGLAVHRIGDCVAPRGVEHALHEGHRLGREL